MKVDEIRERFLKFFERRGHLVQPSAPLSVDDPELLFTIAGMIPFKPFFLREKEPPASRLTTCQLCFRTNDLERVGQTPYHHTFFEMLGNFSFGDYFKEEACEWSLEFVEKELGLKREKIWTTVFKDDDKTPSIWKKLGIPSSRILKKGEEDNFWSAAEVGPCGPDTEIFFDRGSHFSCGKANCEPGCGCARWVEIWNLVFMQFNRDSSGRLSSLPAQNVDTGMGLERVASVLQGVRDDYQTDLFLPIISWLSDVSGQKEDQKSFRVISDHLRGLVFLIEEGVMPSNTGRGYVVRRVLRRAVRYGRKLGLNEPFLYQGVSVVSEVMGKTYPQIRKKEVIERISRIIHTEESSFQATLWRGMRLLEESVEEIKNKGLRVIPSRRVFQLYDTYGVPLDLIEEVAEEEGLTVDEKEFATLLGQQKERSRNIPVTPISLDEDSLNKVIESILKNDHPTEFKGYEKLELSTYILAIIKNGQLRETTQKGEEATIILSSTPFYPEGGGQVADRGKILSSEAEAEVVDVQRKKEVIVHQVKVQRGSLRKNQEVTASVDVYHRNAVRRAHTATHLLQAALRQVLGETVKQSGSLVEEERLRFDFTHSGPLKDKQIEEVKSLVNDIIDQNVLVKTKEVALSEAEKEGATALFEDKYAEKVRVVTVGKFSKEVCGGCHVGRTTEIRGLIIERQSAVAAGIRRIEALVGARAWSELESKKEVLKEIANIWGKKTPGEYLLTQIRQLKEDRDKQEEQKHYWQKKYLQEYKDELIKMAISVAGVKLVRGSWGEVAPDVLRMVAEEIREDVGKGIIVLTSTSIEKAFLVAASTEKNLPAHQIMKELSRRCGGSGGGRWDFAQGGTSHPERVKEALSQVPEIIEDLFNRQRIAGAGGGT